ncbi:patatin-like phospholipase family protein [Chryseolinea sp. H1M3-3]|uniref:patatin-like phospholipase family protein n=1 Tax=Chryseolinea sp. H1M3-3 TaxID=3034144 RepID=UPI0023EADAF6|nr:patatin-like phospholipase family protein [Chryseolinea sp. H1M3-3]
MRFCLLIFFLFTCTVIQAQKVGLVLSGGAAKGLAHVGVLKALEENEIPVDYIVGTSMGGIIGGCYAAGMSPDEIEQMVLSEHFLRWINGLPETGYNYYYHRSDETPQFLKLNLALDSTLNFRFNSSIASDVSLNFALAEKMAQASVISNNNFDSLFVPLRVIAADIFTQSEVVISKGLLSDALRATQTVPFFYNPIRVDGKYLFDGGVYNNFPVDVAAREFKPDVLIGVNVSSKIYDEYPYDNDEKLISRSLLLLLLDKSDPSQIPDRGIYIQPNLKGFTSFDFGRAKSLIDSGYAQTIRQMDEIKSKIETRTLCDDVAAKRNTFKSQSVPFAFDQVTFQKFNSKQRIYIRRIFKTRKRGGEFYYGDIKKGYFKLVSEDYFSNAYPRILYDSTKKKFNFELTRRPQQNFQVDFGGVIATRDISNIYLGFSFYNFNRTLTHAYAGFQTGSFYKSALLKVRKDFPYQFYIEPYLAFDSWDYFENDDLLKNVSSAYPPTVLRRVNRRLGLRAGVPFKHSFKATLNFEGFSNDDRYINGEVFTSTDKLDNLQLKGYKTGVSLSANTLDRKQYASAGQAFNFTFDLFQVTEYFTPGSTSVDSNYTEARYHWWRAKVSAEQYFGSSWFRPGYMIEAVFSNQPFFQNYYGTIINTPGFFPLQDSRTLVLRNFRAFNYIGGGVRNVFKIHNKVDFRLEGYFFRPFEYIRPNEDQNAFAKNNLKTVYLCGTAGFVYHSPIGPVSLSLNYYDDDRNQLGVLMHVGFLLFNKHSLD